MLLVFGVDDYLFNENANATLQIRFPDISYTLAKSKK